MTYKGRAPFPSAAFAETQRPFAEVVRSLTSGIVNEVITQTGDFLYIDQASTGYVTIELNDGSGATLAPITLAAGGSIECDFSKFRLNAPAQLNKSVTILIGNGARIKGGANVNASSMSVSVVDGGLARTLAEKCFMSYASVGAAVGKYSHNQLWNPSTSGKNLFLKSLWTMSTTAQSVTHGYYATALATNSNTPINKKLASTVAAKAQMRTETNVATLYTSQGMGHYVKASEAYNVKFEEHFLIPPGYGYVLYTSAQNVDLTTSFEWYEE